MSMDALSSHPIFSLPNAFPGRLDASGSQSILELSTNTISRFTESESYSQDEILASGKRQVMLLRDSDLIVAVGKEIRMTSLGDTKSKGDLQYKTLWVPNVQFDIHQIALNPTGKLLAVAGATQVAIIVLPRPGFSRLVPEKLDCKAVQIGQNTHATRSSPAVAKVDWHPWGDAGTTLLVLTVDGRIREYDISVDAEEPQQILSFVPERPRRRGFSAASADTDDYEAASFTLGKGRGDWGPLTIYGVMKSGDIYAICPYLPRNASVPSSYVRSLECFIQAKRTLLDEGGVSTIGVTYDYQQKYVDALKKQLPVETNIDEAASVNIRVHPPRTVKASPSRQGPLVLTPQPPMLEDSPGGNATDIVYVTFSDDAPSGYDEDGTETGHLGIVVVSFQDGRVDVCLDVEKVEARWDTNRMRADDPPMLAVFETIDLGLISQLLNSVFPNAEAEHPSILKLLQVNHPVFVIDPMHDDTLYLYHAFGVHVVHLGPVMDSLTRALKDESQGALTVELEKNTGAAVQLLLSTYSMDRQCSNPVIAVTLPDNVYISYSILVLTSAMRVVPLTLNLRTEASSLAPISTPGAAYPATPEPTGSASTPSTIIKQKWLKPVDGPKPYVSLISEPFKIPAVLSRHGLPSNEVLALPKPSNPSQPFMLTPETLRYLATVVTKLQSQIRDVELGSEETMNRMRLQRGEMARLCDKARELQGRVDALRNKKRQETEERVKNIREGHAALMAKANRTLQSMIDNASPELSEEEKKWFDELKRIKRDVEGASKHDELALGNRVATMYREYKRILPELQVMLEKEKAWKAKNGDSAWLGPHEAFEIGKRTNSDASRINALGDSVEDLAKKLDVTLSPRPLGPT
ncbi:hypothetical protein CYLTODRAFT_193304 [Cylindrobasidium torrendii FP15055 ss-10]|uniref:Nucleoporin nup82 n=1 Tax=Cylindrobasidium torrendii FP15055 ss-10 TaxID=1314674 RepID=A0A0D7BTN8_9AGAR|nr:hypothetical protein CYLTODRAFT_193304 [Cylindrobasidium torrendii FP15055 ss-10]